MAELTNIDPNSWAVDGLPAPEDYNPDETGWRNPPPGRYVVFVQSLVKGDDYYTWKWRNQQCVAGKATFRLVVAKGPERNASVLFGVPIPLPGHTPLTELANQFGNFIKSFGFAPPPGFMAPQGFTLGNLIGTADKGPLAICSISYQMKDKAIQRDDSGRPYMQVDLFSFAPFKGEIPINAPLGSETAISGPAAAAVPPAAPASTGPAFDL